MRLLLLTVFFLSGCATNFSSGDFSAITESSINNTQFANATDAEFENLFTRGSVGKLTIWTDENFLTSSALSQRDLINNRDLRIYFEGARKPVFGPTLGETFAKFGKSTKYTVYLPSGKVLITSNSEDRFTLTKTVDLIGGEEMSLFWKSPELNLVKEASSNQSFKNQATKTFFSIVDLNLRALPKFTAAALENSTDKVKLLIKLKDVENVQSVSINGEPLIFNGKSVIEVTKNMKLGLNEYKVTVTNKQGLTNEGWTYVTRLSEAEKRNIEIERQKELKRIENDERLMRLRNAEVEKQNQIRAANEAKARKAEAERIAREGDGSNEDKLCQRYGLKPQTNGYAECRMRLDFAKADSIKQQQQYEREQAAYEQQMAAIQKERERQRAMKQLELGLRMMGGQSPVDAVNSVGTNAPIAPRAPTPTNQTITLPNGRMVNCTTMGTMTNCF